VNFFKWKNWILGRFSLISFIQMEICATPSELDEKISGKSCCVVYVYSKFSPFQEFRLFQLFWVVLGGGS
jgi:hypothetical protein